MGGEAGVFDGFFEEFLALVDAEAVLFVDDGEGEVREFGVVGEEGVGADDEVDFTLLDLLF